MDYGNKTIKVISDVRVDDLINESSESCGTISNFFSNFTDDDFDVSCASHSSPPATPTLPDEPNLEVTIDAVRAKPAIWNIRDEGYKDRDVKIRLWEEVTRESNLEVNAVNIAFIRKQWDTIKSTYIRSKKREPSGSKGKKQKEYKYSRLLSFLDDTTEPRRSIELGGVSDPSIESSSGSVGSSGNPMSGPSSRKRTATPLDSYHKESLEIKRRYVEAVEKIQQPAIPPIPTDSTDAEIDGFLAQLKPYLKGLRTLLRIQAQQGILGVLSDYWKIQENN